MQDKPVFVDFSEGVDRKVLKAITSRFCALNRIRLDRARSALTWHQQIVLDLLPLVFHLNHPALPGYHAGECAHGLDRYEPSEKAVQAAQRIARSFRPGARKTTAELTGLFLMGSPGSLGHSVASDLDVWVCHRPDLPPQRLEALRQKALRLSGWAAEFGLELNLFVFSAEDFRQGRGAAEVSTEDCGSAQHYLLLDEFYRTAIHLGGRYPLWWLIPAQEEGRYEELTRFLLDNRFVRSDEYLDFGAVPSVPVSEFLGAGVWQLYKGIESPWKSLLKLLLIECYARDRDQGLLSARFKRAVYEGSADIDATDPYVMLYRHLEQWLLAMEAPGRLDLVRRALYLKSGLPLTRAAEMSGHWQGQILDQLVTEWGWGRDTLTELDNRHQWRVEQVMALRRRVVSELTHSYRLLSRMARTGSAPSAISAVDLNLLGRKLYAAFQRKAGKVELVNPGIAPSLAEENLAFWHGLSPGRAVAADGWRLFRNLDTQSAVDGQPVIRKAGSLVELVTWCHCNRLLTPATRLNMRQEVPDGDSGGTRLSVSDLRSMARFVSSHLGTLTPASRDALMAPARPEVHLLLVNVGVDPQASLTERGLHKLSGRHDSLGFSGGRDNLVATIEQVSLNTWHEVSLQRYLTGDALLQCLKNMLALVARSPARPPRVEVWCAGGSHAAAITRRIRELVDDVTRQFFAGGAGPHPLRYLIKVDQRWFVLRFDGHEPGFTGLANDRELMDYLARPQQVYSPVVPDRYALQEDPAFREVCRACQPDVVQMFWQQSGKWLRFWVADETGSLYGWRQPRSGSRRQALVPLMRFLEKLAEKRRLRQMAGSAREDTELVCAEVVLEAGEARLERTPLPPESLSLEAMELQATGVQQGDGSIRFDLYCDEEAFTVEEYGEFQMAAVADYIRQRRRGGDSYPVHLTDLHLPNDLDPQMWQQELQTCQYVWYRHRLQRELTEALARA
ncbi:adenylate cyclase, class 1 [Marinobacter segnicrescens]|uniref:Adenylate cyclase, class 1 n=1 Tax=Marinobacter segnicrescens TaxID=430453 RepID=A0A1I0FCX6_9GAMM|nr:MULTISPECIES: class I adenylate cyclase [Marinobacter]UZD65210.1 class I adenylate cyclase [Marinobacter sp. AN1]SET56114.1 adenylate cyclase, class 1 [Marinobacter segnicrescens]